ncbi:hypothetical protein ACFPM0_28620 [Pseudonocardia sulfidoxydans]|uniref:hypothetical protein n=1 Tax=Pseudonocardia sulfidoxydans TaxID=54011 RepID=UPI00360E6C7D
MVEQVTGCLHGGGYHSGVHPVSPAQGERDGVEQSRQPQHHAFLDRSGAAQASQSDRLE